MVDHCRNHSVVVVNGGADAGGLCQGVAADEGAVQRTAHGSIVHGDLLAVTQGADLVFHRRQVVLVLCAHALQDALLLLAQQLLDRGHLGVQIVNGLHLALVNLAVVILQGVLGGLEMAAALGSQGDQLFFHVRYLHLCFSRLSLASICQSL